MPGLELDTSFLLIGHVDELITFVPDRSGGFRVIMPSVAEALNIMRSAIRQAKGPVSMLSNTEETTMVDRILNDDAFIAECGSVQNALEANYARVCEGLGVEAEDILYVPALFRAGISFTPNPV